MTKIIMCENVDVTGDWDFELKALEEVYIDGGKPSVVLPKILELLEKAHKQLHEIQSKNLFATDVWCADYVSDFFLHACSDIPDNDTWQYQVVVDERMPKKDGDSIEYAEIVTIYKPLSPYAGLAHDPERGVYSEWCYGSKIRPSVEVWAKAIEENVEYALTHTEGEAADKWNEVVLQW